MQTILPGDEWTPISPDDEKMVTRTLTTLKDEAEKGKATTDMKQGPTGRLTVTGRTHTAEISTRTYGTLIMIRETKTGTQTQVVADDADTTTQDLVDALYEIDEQKAQTSDN